MREMNADNVLTTNLHFDLLVASQVLNQINEDSIKKIPEPFKQFMQQTFQFHANTAQEFVNRIQGIDYGHTV